MFNKVLWIGILLLTAATNAFAQVENDVALKASGSIENQDTTSSSRNGGLSLEWVWMNTKSDEGQRYISIASKLYSKFTRKRLQGSTESINEYGLDGLQITWEKAKPPGSGKNELAGIRPYIALGGLRKLTRITSSTGITTPENFWGTSYKAGVKIYLGNIEMANFDLSATIKYQGIMRKKDSNSIELTTEINLSKAWNALFGE